MNTSNRFTLLVPVSIFVLLVSAILFSGCQKEELPPSAQEILDQTLANVDRVQLNSDIAIIDDTLDMRGLSAMILKEPNGVRYTIDSVSSEVITPVLENFVQFNYTGRLLSTGEQFDSGQNSSFLLANLIPGFQTTLPLIPVGSTATLYIPSGLGYGPTERTDNAGNVLIPANSNLVFEIELIGIF